MFAFAGWHSRVTQATAALLEISDDAKFVPCTVLKGPADTYCRSIGAFNDSAFVIAKGAKNIEAALTYLNWEYASLDNYMTAIYGIKGEDWTEGVPGEMADRTLKYVSEALVGAQFAFTMQMTSSETNSAPAYWYYANMLLDADHSTPNNFAAVRSLMDLTDFSDETSVDDIDRMLSEEYVKFIMNERPIEEYDQFLEELKAAGSEQMLEYLTERYQEAIG